MINWNCLVNDWTWSRLLEIHVQPQWMLQHFQARSNLYGLLSFNAKIYHVHELSQQGVVARCCNAFFNRIYCQIHTALHTFWCKPPPLLRSCVTGL